MFSAFDFNLKRDHRGSIGTVFSSFSDQCIFLIGIIRGSMNNFFRGRYMGFPFD